MQFDVSHVIDGMDVAQLERLYFDETFNEAMCQAVGLKRRLLRLNDAGDSVIREVEIEPERQIPGPVAKILRGQTMSYIEHLSYDRKAHQGVWRTTSSVLTDKVKSDGTLAFEQAGSGTRRIVTGHVTVAIFAVGSVIERFVVADVKDSYARAAQFTQFYAPTV